MTMKVWIAKYVSDPRRWEPRNVGVIVAGVDKAAAIFVGEREDGTVDGRSVKGLVADTANYQEWVRHWQGTKLGGVELLSHEAARSMRDDANYFLFEAADVWMSDETVDDCASRLFEEVVETTHQFDDAPLQSRVEGILKRARLFDSPHFYKNYVFDAEVHGTKRELHFPYAWVNGRRVVGTAVPDDTSRIDAVLWRFEHLPDDFRRIAFVGAPQAKRPKSAAYDPVLQSLATVVSVDEGNVEAKVVELFTGD